MALLSPYFLTERNLAEPRLPDVDRRRARARAAAGDPHARDRPLGRLGRRARGRGRRRGRPATSGAGERSSLFVRHRRSPSALVNGAVLVWGRVMNPFIVTLGTLGIAPRPRAGPLRRRDAHRAAGRRRHARLRAASAGCPCRSCSSPASRWRIGCCSTATQWGRWIYAVGGNPEAARRAGIPVDARADLGLRRCAGCSPAIAGDPRRRPHRRRRRRRPGSCSSSTRSPP